MPKNRGGFATATANVKKFLISPDLVFFALMWLMVLVVAGTVAQKYIGLFRAQNIFFSSWLLWWGPVPLPGGLSTIGAVFVGLLAKLTLASPWNRRNAGVIITHIGALMLLSGGLVTALFAKEGSMVIYEGGKSAYFEDYHYRHLTVTETDTQKVMVEFPWADFEDGATLHVAAQNAPFTVSIVKYCRNCAIFPRVDKTGPFKGRARDFDIAPVAQEKEDERNKSAMLFRVTGADAGQDGVYFSVDFLDVAPVIVAGGKSYRIALEKRKTPLPFEIELVKFSRSYHPGTTIPSSYRSDVIVRDGAAEWKSQVQMNEPLRYKGYTFFQSSFMDDGQRPATVLAVVQNAGRAFPYVSSILMCIGLLIHMSIKLPELLRGRASRAKKAMLVAVVALGFLLVPQAAHASIYVFDNSVLEKLPVLDQGRVKPFDSFAKHYLQAFSGHDSLPGMDATEWMAEVLFTPEKAYERRIFDVADPRVTDAIGVERRSPHMYSFTELSDGIRANVQAWRGLFDLPPDQLTASQKTLLALYNDIQTFYDLSRSLSLVFPAFTVQPELARKLGIPADTPLSFLDIAPLADKIALMAKKSGKKSRAAELAAQLERLGLDRQSELFRIVPAQWDQAADEGMWYSLWSVGAAGQASQETLAYTLQWKALLTAYSMGDTAVWQQTSQAIYDASLAMAQGKVNFFRVNLEVFYNQAAPLFWGMIAYLASFVLAVLSFFVLQKPLYRVAAAFFVSALALNGVGLLMRMMIMGRPPVTNLYASILFVGFIVGAFCLYYEWRKRNGIGMTSAAVSGALLLYIATRFETSGDTMGMLTAVLDTNFWLATHVVTITIGYGCSIMGSVMAHIYLLLRLARGAKAERTAADLALSIRGIAYVALFFSALGTILGGIWADQSWGRFWGWDPKENGALLVVLWILCVTHGRLAKRLDDASFAAGMAMLSVAVALAWFGVNILSVGLHSYGFTEGAAMGLGAFCAGETLYALLMLYAVRRKEARA